jgi:hypothetical protein
MPGLRVLCCRRRDCFGVAPDVAHAVLDDLRRASVLTYSDGWTYSLSR